MIDYHVHTNYSADASATLAEQLEAAAERGLSEICFTDHVDFDNGDKSMQPSDLGALREQLRPYGGFYKGVRIRRGAEVGLNDAHCAAQAKEYIAPHELDFVIGSIHVVNGFDVYYPEYYIGKTKQDAYLSYLQTILRGIKTCEYMSILGHYDFIAKYSPYEDRRMTLDVSKELFSEIFTYLIQNGKGIEINTSAWWDEPRWGEDILKLYRALGGEFITTGSDAHRSDRVAKRIKDAEELAAATGIPFIATFEKMKPVLHPIGSI